MLLKDESEGEDDQINKYLPLPFSMTNIYIHFAKSLLVSDLVCHVEPLEDLVYGHRIKYKIK